VEGNPHTWIWENLCLRKQTNVILICIFKWFLIEFTWYGRVSKGQAEVCGWCLCNGNMVLQAVVGAPWGCPVTWPAINAIIITNRPCIFFLKNLNRLSNVLEDATTETPKVAWNTTPVTQLDLSIYISFI
jgi:hypothetical protein